MAVHFPGCTCRSLAPPLYYSVQSIPSTDTFVCTGSMYHITTSDLQAAQRLVQSFKEPELQGTSTDRETSAGTTIHTLLLLFAVRSR